MKIFIGSSREGLADLKGIAAWVQASGHDAIPWNRPGLFPVGHYSFETLNSIKDSVDASIFVFGGDDRVWYRSDATRSPRDNVLVEYGLFAGVLEPSRVAICKRGRIRIPTDLQGVTYVDLKDPVRAHLEMQAWMLRIAKTAPAHGRARLMTFQNKFSMPDTNQYWRGLAESATARFLLLGGTNKSWIHHSAERRRELGRSILRIIRGGGHVAMLCYDTKAALREHAAFIDECVVGEVTSRSVSQRRIQLARVARSLRVAATNTLKYQAVISDARIVVMPLLNSEQFKEESPVFELSEARHGEHYTTYQNDIVRTVDHCEKKGFVAKICAR